ncbi:MAG: hypothetical protein HFJ12_01345 [Bacilli bacterium]|nr:hypothetical protein [Bacilli bacterium]
MKEVIKKNKVLFIVIGVFTLFIIFSVILSEYVENNDIKLTDEPTTENKTSTEDKNQKQEQDTSEVVKESICNKDNDMTDNLTQILNTNYPYGASLGIFWKVTGESENSCTYQDTIKIKNEYGTKSKHELAVITNISEDGTEIIKSVLVDNIEIYKQ